MFSCCKSNESSESTSPVSSPISRQDEREPSSIFKSIRCSDNAPLRIHSFLPTSSSKRDLNIFGSLSLSHPTEFDLLNRSVLRSKSSSAEEEKTCILNTEISETKSLWTSEEQFSQQASTLPQDPQPNAVSEDTEESKAISHQLSQEETSSHFHFATSLSIESPSDEVFLPLVAINKIESPFSLSSNDNSSTNVAHPTSIPQKIAVNWEHSRLSREETPRTTLSASAKTPFPDPFRIRAKMPLSSGVSQLTTSLLPPAPNNFSGEELAEEEEENSRGAERGPSFGDHLKYLQAKQRLQVPKYNENKLASAEEMAKIALSPKFFKALRWYAQNLSQQYHHPEHKGQQEGLTFPELPSLMLKPSENPLSIRNFYKNHNINQILREGENILKLLLSSWSSLCQKNEGVPHFITNMLQTAFIILRQAVEHPNRSPQDHEYLQWAVDQLARVQGQLNLMLDVLNSHLDEDPSGST